jgi:hypothetical protein
MIARLLALWAILLPVSLEDAGKTCPRVDAAPAARSNDGPKIIPAFTAVLPGHPGCSPMLRALPGGGISWLGCPTSQCQPVDCQAEEDDAGPAILIRCVCPQAGWVLCEGTVQISTQGLVVNWDCQQGACQNACTENWAPMPVEEGPAIDFWACDC